MSDSSPLDKWRFLVGEWKSAAKDQFGEKGVVESVTVFSLEPSERFIMAKGESWCEGRLLNKAPSLLFYDKSADKFRRKLFFSYGFVNNEVEYERDENEIKFEVEVEPSPKEFESIRWRSFIRKASDKQIAMGLELAKGEEELRKYGASVYIKVK